MPDSGVPFLLSLLYRSLFVTSGVLLDAGALESDSHEDEKGVVLRFMGHVEGLFRLIVAGKVHGGSTLLRIQVGAPPRWVVAREKGCGEYMRS